MGCGSSKGTKTDDEPKAGPAPPKSTATPAPHEPHHVDQPAVEDAPVLAAGDTPEGFKDMASSRAPFKVYIVYYSMYGHVEKLASELASGVVSAGGTAKCYRVPEILPEEVLEKMSAPPKNESHPVIAPADLKDADALVFAFPTRFGTMCSQMKSFFDATGSLWQNGELAGKPATLAVSVGTQGGGTETTLLTAATQLTHHGMIFIPIGYTAGDKLFDIFELRGGSPWGAGTFAGADGSRNPSSRELELARHQGSYFASKAFKLV